MSITLLTDLPDLVILDILPYLSSFDAIQAFYNIDNTTNRVIIVIQQNTHIHLEVFNEPRSSTISSSSFDYER
jgi:hypothetical protein